MHPEVVESVLVTCCSRADCTALWCIWQSTPGNLIERLCSISFGFALPVGENRKLDRDFESPLRDSFSKEALLDPQLYLKLGCKFEFDVM